MFSKNSISLIIGFLLVPFRTAAMVCTSPSCGTTHPTKLMSSSRFVSWGNLRVAFPNYRAPISIDTEKPVFVYAWLPPSLRVPVTTLTRMRRSTNSAGIESSEFGARQYLSICGKEIWRTACTSRHEVKQISSRPRCTWKP